MPTVRAVIAATQRVLVFYVMSKAKIYHCLRMALRPGTGEPRRPTQTASGPRAPTKEGAAPTTAPRRLLRAAHEGTMLIGDSHLGKNG